MPKKPAPLSELKKQINNLRYAATNRASAKRSYENRKAAGTLKPKIPLTAAQIARYNTNRREKSARNRLKQKESQENEVQTYRQGGCSIVSATAIHLDTTRWIGPEGWNIRVAHRELEEAADRLLTDAAIREYIDEDKTAALQIAFALSPQEDTQRENRQPEGLDWINIDLSAWK